MTHSVTIPQDIIYKIIAAVGDDNYVLKQCALVSSSFLMPSRKQLFSKISLRWDRDPHGLYQFLIYNPVIQSFVRRIAISQNWGQNMSNTTSLLGILRLPFCCLESFSIYSWEPMHWSNFSSGLKDALSNIIHLSTLKSLSLQRVNVPITLFLGIVHLEALELDSISPRSFDVGKTSSLTPAASKEVATTAPHPVIDECVWYFRKFWCGSTEPIFLPFMCRLRYFEIQANPGSAVMGDFTILSVLIQSLCTSLTSPATLEHLRVEIWFFASHNDFNYSGLIEDLREADVWRHLDSIIAHPAGSRLQRVDIDIKYAFRYNNNVWEPTSDEIMESVLGALPFLRKRDILFVDATVG